MQLKKYQTPVHDYIISCEYCGKKCELAYTTGDCCPCFTEHSMLPPEEMPWCKICETRENKEKEHQEWIQKNTIPLNNFLS